MPVAKPRMTRFYVSARDEVRNPTRYALLLGPYPTRAEAEANVARGTELACDYDRWAWFYAFGVCGTTDDRKTAFGR